MEEGHHTKDESKKKDWRLSQHFKSVFTIEDMETLLPDMPRDQYPPMAIGPDFLLSRVLKECAPQIVQYLTVIYNQSLSQQKLS